VSTCDATSARQTVEIFYIIWQETLKVAASTEGGLKVNKLMHVVFNFIRVFIFLGKLK